MRVETPILRKGSAKKKILSLLAHNFNTPVSVLTMSDRCGILRSSARRRTSEMVKAGILIHHDTTMDVESGMPIFTYKLA